MKKALLLTLLPAFLALAGCDYDFTSPTATVNSVGLALNTGNYNKFVDSLGGQAKVAYGTPDGMAALQQRLAGKTLVTVPARSVSKGHCGSACTYSVWYVQVLNGATHEADVWVTCKQTRSGGHKLPMGTTYANNCKVTDFR